MRFVFEITYLTYNLLVWISLGVAEFCLLEIDLILIKISPYNKEYLIR